MADEVPAAHVAYYDLAPLYAPGWSAAPARAKLTRQLREEKLTLFLRRPDGVEEEIRPSSRRLEDGTAIMAMTFLGSAERGAEVDCVVAGTHQDLLLATFWWDEGKLVVQQKHHTGGLLHEGPSEAVLRERYGVGRLLEGDRPWDPFARGLVERAYERMSEEERDIVEYLTFYRVREDFQEEAAAKYFHEDARIELYDVAVAQSPRFVGDLTDPSPSSLKTVLHEIGHGFMFAPERAGRLLLEQLEAEHELDQARPAQAQDPVRLQARLAAISAIHERLEARPVLDAYVVAVGNELAPTPYGRTSSVEGFAEAFALWHLDPAALRRTSPRAAAFFESGSHIQAARQATEHVQELASQAWGAR
jgi:hypothetical protein